MYKREFEICVLNLEEYLDISRITLIFMQLCSNHIEIYIVENAMIIGSMTTISIGMRFFRVKPKVKVCLCLKWTISYHTKDRYNLKETKNKQQILTNEVLMFNKQLR